jgi:Zn-finger nucleic acid-binding protein
MTDMLLASPVTRKSIADRRYECPACGGGGGGPFGRSGSAWDVETYVCPRCEGLGVVVDGVVLARPLAKARTEPAERAPRPGIAQAPAPAAATKKTRASPA